MRPNEPAHDISVRIKYTDSRNIRSRYPLLPSGLAKQVLGGKDRRLRIVLVEQNGWHWHPLPQSSGPTIGHAGAAMVIEQRLEQCLVETQILAVSEGHKPDGHGLMTCRRLGPVGAAEIVPPGKCESEVCVGLDGRRRMMHTMHIWDDDEEPEDTNDGEGQTEVVVMDHRPGRHKQFQIEHRQ